MARFLVIHGPNLNLLGTREPDYYGRSNLEAINQQLHSLAERSGHQLDCLQSNAEHELLARVHALVERPVSGLVINPAAFTHTSVALRDALLAVQVPFIEVHLSNVYARESFRHHSYFSDIAIGVISGLGPRGYEYALAELMAREN